MRTPYHPNVKGFEFVPEGKLLRTLIDMKGRMGIAYERSIDYLREIYHAHDRLNWSFPRKACHVEIQVKMSPGKTKLFHLDSSKLLSIPKEQEHNHRGKTLIYDTMALYPSDAILEEAAERLGLGKSQVKDFFGECHLIKRNSFLDELLERYFAERVLKNAPASQRRNALEDQILDEIFRLSFGATGLPAREVDKDEHQNVTERGIQFIEANLFSALSSREIAVYCRTSVASLFRVFKKDLGRTPFDYVRERRLDEAFQLLKGKRYSVSDVALLVGYEDLSAFSKAFKKKFRKNPSDVLKV